MVFDAGELQLCEARARFPWTNWRHWKRVLLVDEVIVMASIDGPKAVQLIHGLHPKLKKSGCKAVLKGRTLNENLKRANWEVIIGRPTLFFLLSTGALAAMRKYPLPEMAWMDKLGKMGAPVASPAQIRVLLGASTVASLALVKRNVIRRQNLSTSIRLLNSHANKYENVDDMRSPLVRALDNERTPFQQGSLFIHLSEVWQGDKVFNRSEIFSKKK